MHGTDFIDPASEAAHCMGVHKDGRAVKQMHRAVLLRALAPPGCCERAARYPVRVTFVHHYHDDPAINREVGR